MMRLSVLPHYRAKWSGVLRVALCSLITAGAGTSLHADSLPATPAKPEEVKDATSNHFGLERDASLAVQVTLTAKAQPLEEVLATLQEQSGIRLKADPAAIKVRRLVTARVKDMPLATFLGSLTRMYGVQWVKDDDRSYIMRSGEMDALRRSMLATGEPYWYRYRYRLSYNYILEKQRRAEIAQYIYKQLGTGALTTPEGVAFTSLPEEWKPELYGIVQVPQAEALIRERRLLDRVFSQPLFLHLGKTPPDIKPAGPGISVPHGHMPELTIRDAEGRFVAQLMSLRNALLSGRAATPTGK